MAESPRHDEFELMLEHPEEWRRFFRAVDEDGRETPTNGGWQQNAPDGWAAYNDGFAGYSTQGQVMCMPVDWQAHALYVRWWMAAQMGQWAPIPPFLEGGVVRGQNKRGRKSGLQKRPDMDPSTNFNQRCRFAFCRSRKVRGHLCSQHCCTSLDCKNLAPPPFIKEFCSPECQANHTCRMPGCELTRARRGTKYKGDYCKAHGELHGQHGRPQPQA
mmetsp:Transcript_12544/g.19733  ORF Transcript_12544/g.19733 Transcript_12544/m.19733 type:complete len:216 (-) Transcript_12544:136-783(-)|eukprot:CAMPEP_0184289330 /NCGR_PEP_ID=MMETSP1049-20130417/1784_1 /TAXON_ID=77928 /ORGANISM="Proteomonas sulcata, Strain CCMP704" /LENGTH=215 /DNA_ID=CAMNT_0026596075 /DNA_START=122 /DNA_END=769 /DNA_ORIENTATION=-